MIHTNHGIMSVGLVYTVFGCVLVLAWAVPIAAQSTAPVYIDSFGSSGTGDGQFTWPTGIAVNGAGQVYVVDRSQRRVQRFDANGDYQMQWGSSGYGDGQFNGPVGIAVSSNGKVYVSDSSQSRVQRFDGDGNFELKWGSYGTGNGQFIGAYGIDVASTGEVYVGESSISGNRRVQRFSDSGVYQATFSGSTSGVYGVAVSNTHLYSTYADIDMVGYGELSNPAGGLRPRGASGGGEGEFSGPMGVTAGNTGRAYYVDTENNRVQVYGGSFPQYQTEFGSYGTLDGQMAQPTDAAVSNTGVVYIIDDGNDRIQRWFSPSEWTSPGTNMFPELALNEDLNLASGYNLTVSGTTTVANGVTLTTGGGTLDGGTLSLQSGATLQAGSSVSQAVFGQGLAAINVTASGVSVGKASSYIGFNHAGILAVGANSVTLNSKGLASLGALTTLDGGQISAPNGVAFGAGSNLVGSGTVNARVAAYTGSAIYASGGDLALGNASSPVGFVTDGELYTDVNTIALYDSNQAVLGALTQVGDGLGGSGTLNAANGIIVDFGRNLVGEGTVNSTESLATATIINGSVQGDGSGLELTGYVKGVGTFAGNVIFGGTYSPGLSPAAVYLENMTLRPTSTLLVELAGTTPGSEYDVLNVAGSVTLSGTLAVELIDGFTPEVGDSFSIIHFDSVVSDFDHYLGLDLEGAVYLKPTLTDDSLILTAVQQVPGDANLDGVVDNKDASVLGAHWLQSGNWLDGDFNDDTVINDADAAILAAHWGQGVGEESVPEPGSLALLAGMVVMGVVCLRRRMA